MQKDINKYEKNNLNQLKEKIKLLLLQSVL